MRCIKNKKNVEKIEQIHLQVQETRNKSYKKYKVRHDQYRTNKTFRVGDIVWLQLDNERLQGPSKKIKAM